MEIRETQDTAAEQIVLYTPKQDLRNKKIYFDANGTEVKIWYDDETGVGFVEIIPAYNA